MRRFLVSLRGVLVAAGVIVALAAIGVYALCLMLYEQVRHPRQVRARMAGLRALERAEDAEAAQWRQLDREVMARKRAAA